MKATDGGTSVSILGKEFGIACPPDERDALQAAASHLDRRMREIQESGKVIGAERCAIMAALNISHELLAARKDGVVGSEIERRLQNLQARIDGVLQGELSEEV